MELANPPHEREVGCRHRPGQVINAPQADVQRRRLLGNRQIVLTVDHRSACDPVKKPGPWAVARLKVVTPSRRSRLRI
jgi:hypothetical protein